MRLTLVMLKRKMPNGNIWLGKHRLSHHIFPGNIERMVKRIQIEERNLLLLRHPYMTMEQEIETKALNKFRQRLVQWRLQDAATSTKYSRTFEDHYNHLKYGENWDP